MHALRHVHRLVVPGGTFVDLHPVTEQRVEAVGRTLGVIAEPTWMSRDLPNAEAGLEDAVRAGLFAPEAEERFDLLERFDEPEELLEAKEELLAEQPELAARIRAATPPLVAREHVVMRRFCVLPAA